MQTAEPTELSIYQDLRLHCIPIYASQRPPWYWGNNEDSAQSKQKQPSPSPRPHFYPLRGSREIFRLPDEVMESRSHYKMEAPAALALDPLWGPKDETLFDLVITHYSRFAVRPFARSPPDPFVRSFVAFFLPNGLFASFCFPQRFLARRSFRRSAFALGRLWI